EQQFENLLPPSWELLLESAANLAILDVARALQPSQVSRRRDANLFLRGGEVTCRGFAAELLRARDHVLLYQLIDLLSVHVLLDAELGGPIRERLWQLNHFASCQVAAIRGHQ